MSESLIVNGVTFEYPELGDEGWAEDATGWASAVTQGMLQKAGGSFTLTAEVNFGATFGLKTAYYKSRATNPSSSGILRLGNTETIAWRNALNDGNIILSVDANNDFAFTGDLMSSANNTHDLGSTGVRWKNLWLAGNGTIGGTLDVTGATTITGNLNLLAQAELRLQDTSGGEYVALRASGTQATYTITLPAAAPGNNTTLGYNGTNYVWATPGTGDVVGPASSVDNTLPRFDGVTGRLLQASGLLVDDSDNVSGIVNLTVTGTTTLATSLTGVVKAVSGVLSAATILDVDVNAAAGIVYSKLSLAGSILDADLSASAAIAFSKFASLASGNILVGSGGGVATSVPVTGDITISNTGVVAIGALKVTNAMLAGSIAYGKLSLTGAILNADLAGSIAYGKLSLTGAILNADLASVSTQTFKGRTSASSGVVEDLTATQATAILNAMVGDSGAGGTKGLVPAPASGDTAAGKFLKADGTWKLPAGSGTVTDKSADYTILDADGISVVIMTTAGTDRTVTLPAAANNTNRVLSIVKVDSGTGIVPISGTINGQTDIKLFNQGNFIMIASDGSTWNTISYDIYEFLFNTTTDNSNDTTSFGYGAAGVLIPNRTVGTQVLKAVRARSTLNENDILDGEFLFTSGDVSWQKIDIIFANIAQGTSRYGVQISERSGSDTDIDVTFRAQGARPTNATYAGNGDAFSDYFTANNKWRIRRQVKI